MAARWSEIVRRLRDCARSAFLVSISACAPAVAQDSVAAFYRGKTMTLQVGASAGGGVDLNARILADRLNQQLPQRVLVENMGGGGGSIAARAVANSNPDGYTFLFAGPGHAAVPFKIGRAHV